MHAHIAALIRDHAGSLRVGALRCRRRLASLRWRGHGRSSTPMIRSPREPETQDASKVQAWEIDLVVDLDVQPVRTTRRSDAERPRAERQHDRRGAGLELVHQPDLARSRSRSRKRARAEHHRRAGTGQVDDHPAEEGRTRAGLHRARRGRRYLVRLVRRRAAIRRPRPAPSSSPTRSSGRSATGRSRTT